MADKYTFQSIINDKMKTPEPAAAAASGATTTGFLNPITWTIIIGVIGLIVGTILFLSGKRSYGEIAIEKRPLFHKLFRERIKCLNDNIAFRTRRINAGGKDYADSASDWTSAIHNAQVAIKTTENEQIKLDSGNTDTSLVYLAQFAQVKRSEYLARLTSSVWQTKNDTTYADVPATLLDTCRACLHYPLATIYPLRLYQHKRAKPIDFFRDYPSFGLWIVFSIAQLVLWALLLPFLYGNIAFLNGQLANPGYMVKPRQIVQNAIFPLVIISIFCFLFYQELIGEWLITDAAFLESLQLRVTIYAVIGYLIAAVCFGMFLTLTRKLDEIDADVKGKLTRDDSTHLDDTYKALRSAFNRSFYCSALILSFVVFWTGILINGVNGTEGMRFYFLLSKKDFIPTDFAYLLGLMHTIILLIFYIPAKLKFNSLSITQNAPDDDKNASGLFSALGSSFGPLLLTASPLLAGLVNSLLGLLVKN